MNSSTYPHFSGTGSAQTLRRKNAWPRNLFILLVLQLVVAIAIYSYQRNAQPQVEAKPLIDFSFDKVDKWLVSDANAQVTLVKSGSTWQLPDLHQLPVDAQKLDGLVEKLKGTTLTWPVATTESSHERFDVAENKFQRRVEFFEGDKKTGEIFLGTSPGFKKVHLRRAGDKDVYAVELSSFEFASVTKDWLDSALLAAKQPVQIRGADYQVQQDGDNWRFVDDATTSLDKAKITAVVDGIAGLAVQDVAAQTLEGQKESITVKTAEAEWQYDFIKAGEDYFVKRSDRDQFFKISKADYDRIVLPKKQDLIASATTTSTTDPVQDIVNSALQGATP